MSNDIDLGFDGPLCVVDVETTGLDPNVDRIISVAALHVNLDDIRKDRLKGDILTAVMDPEHPIHPKASAVNGFRNRDLRGKPVFADEAVEIREFIGSRRVVGHNVAFDKQFLNAEFKRAGVKTLSRNPSACTMAGVKSIMAHVGRHGNKWNRQSLDRASALFGAGRRKSKVHDAEEDVILAVRLAHQLRQLAQMPKHKAKEEIRELIELLPEEADRRERYTRRRKGEDFEATTAKSAGCSGTLGVVVVAAVVLWWLAS